MRNVTSFLKLGKKILRAKNKTNMQVDRRQLKKMHFAVVTVDFEGVPDVLYA